MTKFESKTVNINAQDERIYNFLGNFNNISQFVPLDKVKDWVATESSCSFSANMIGMVSIRIIEKEPFSLIKMEGEAMGKTAFNFWVQLKKTAPYETKIKLTFGADLNPMMKMMVNKHIRTFLDTLVDQIASFVY
jgi:carbon monoxide dehydrogenase subunit G